MQIEPQKLALGVIGCGHWGPNHVRVFSELERSEVLMCADPSETRLTAVRGRFPAVATTVDYRDILADDRIDAVVIATPTATHVDIARQALQAGKHLLVEKPLCVDSREAVELGILAEKVERVLMVGHVFLYNDAINRLHETIQTGELGRIHYLDAARTNLGPVRGDVNALYDLGTHDISIFNFLLGMTPIEVSASGRCIAQDSIEDVCFATMKYPDGSLGHLHVSWLNPRKVRTMTVIGEKKMAHWDDIDPTDTLRVFDKGLDEPPYYDSFGAFHCALRNADVHLPAVRSREPLRNQAEAFLDWVLDGKQSISDVRFAHNVARVLEAAKRSMQQGGVMCRVDTVPDEVCTVASMPVSDVLPGRVSPQPVAPPMPAIQ